MTQKTLEKGSIWEKADTNGDGMVTDKEMAIKERMVIVLMTPLVPIERIDHLSGIAEIWVLSNMGVLASFIGFNQLAKRNGEEKRPH